MDSTSGINSEQFNNDTCHQQMMSIGAEQILNIAAYNRQSNFDDHNSQLLFVNSQQHSIKPSSIQQGAPNQSYTTNIPQRVPNQSFSTNILQGSLRKRTSTSKQDEHPQKFVSADGMIGSVVTQPYPPYMRFSQNVLLNRYFRIC